jgi:hypothetical protein
MNACESENYLAISRSSSASNSVEIFWAEIYRGRLFLKAESSLIQSNCRSLRNLKSELPRRNKKYCQYVRRDLIN